MTYHISVLISTYNDRRLVAKKLAEIKAQTIFNNAEFIFIETASPEKERELLVPFCDTHDNCMLITSDEHKTLYEAWNLGWDAASSPVICYSNMDDCMHPALLDNVVREINAHNWDACTVLIGKQKLNEARPEDMWSPARLARLRLVYRPGPFTAWRADLAARAGRFDGKLHTRGDKDFWSRIVHHGLKTGVIKKVLYLYSRSNDQISKSGSFATKRKLDKSLIRNKPYPSRWPWRRFPRYYALQLQLRLFPETLCVTVPPDTP
jgi:glycosyltransferase involved in cell wall biosynthesis